MLLKANKYRKDKKADCRQNELGSRIFMGRVFGDYAECLHFYPSFSYGRIIAGEISSPAYNPMQSSNLCHRLFHLLLCPFIHITVKIKKGDRLFEKIFDSYLVNGLPLSCATFLWYNLKQAVDCCCNEYP